MKNQWGTSEQEWGDVSSPNACSSTAHGPPSTTAPKGPALLEQVQKLLLEQREIFATFQQQNNLATQDQPAGRKPAEQQRADDDAAQQRPSPADPADPPAAPNTADPPADPADPPAAPNTLPIPPIMHPPIQPTEEHQLHGPAAAGADQSGGSAPNAEAEPPLCNRRWPWPAAVVADHQRKKKMAQLAIDCMEPHERQELAVAVAEHAHGEEILDAVLEATGAADAAPAPAAPENPAVSAPEAAGSEAAAEATASADAAAPSDNLDRLQ